MKFMGRIFTGMSDYISRDAAIKARHNCNKDCATCDFAIEGDSWCQGEIWAVDILRIPAADVVERKKGKWEKAYLGHEAFGIRPQVWYCSECQQITSFRTFYCPNCGADMRGGT